MINHTHNGNDRSMLASKLSTKKKTAPVTHQDSKEHIKVLAKSKMHESLFHATGGGHIVNNVVFKSWKCWFMIRDQAYGKG